MSGRYVLLYYFRLMLMSQDAAYLIRRMNAMPEKDRPYLRVVWFDNI